MEAPHAQEILDRLRTHASRRPDAPAVSQAVSRDSTLSYAQLLERVERQALVLRDLAEPDELCLLVTQRHVELICALLAGLAAGRPVAVFDPRQGLQRLQEVLTVAGSGLIVADAAARMLVGPLGLASRGTVHAAAAAGPPGDLTAHRFGPLAAVRNVPPPDTAVVLFTSGSTGIPRGVCIAAADLAFRARTEVEWFGLAANDTTLGVLPLSFDVGLTQLLGTLWAGGQHVLLASWLPGDIARAIEEWRPCGMAASPMVWQAHLRTPGCSWSALRGLRFVTLSGGDLPELQLLKLAAALAPCNLFKTYGLSEMFRIASLRPEELAARPTSVGRAYPGAHFAVTREDGSECAANEIGEVVAWGRGQMSGYLNQGERNPVRQDHRIPRAPAAGVLYTGDFGRVDEHGYLNVAGRRDDMLKIADQRVYPREVARLIERLLGLEAVVIIPFPTETGLAFAGFHTDPQWAQREADALEELRKRMPGYMVPRRLIALEEFPSTASGKIDRMSLARFL